MNDDEPTSCLRSLVSTVLLATVLIVVLGLLFWWMSVPTSA